MKKYALLSLVIFYSCFLYAQIKNSGFELPVASLPQLPDNWTILANTGYNVLLDTSIKHGGRSSLQINASEAHLDGKDLTFQQILPFNSPTLIRIEVSAWIRTSDIEDLVGLYCHSLDQQGKKIFGGSLRQQGIVLTGTNEWKKYSCTVVVDPNTHSIKFGGYLRGKGKVWFDDFEVTPLHLPFPSVPKSTRHYVQVLCRKVRKNALYSDSLDWKQVTREIRSLSEGIRNGEDPSFLAMYLMYKLEQKGDMHSSFMPKSKVIELSSHRADKRCPEGKKIREHIGYIKVPGFRTLQDSTMNAFAAQLQDLIRNLDTTNEIKGWVVDLRENTGGNMYPMIAGLGPLLGNGKLGSFVYPKRKHSSAWTYVDGKCGSHTHTLVHVKDYYVLKRSGVKIAVLIGPNTASSGEMTLMSFIGKSNVKTFGVPTGGYTSSNGKYKLPGGSCLFLADSYTADRNNKIYTSKINPDQLINEPDQVLPTALQWLNEP
ncbi:MAG TPA: S41 family peptidase [Bacteroidia bacterium]|nr:S41 family peptidase [Bacteroidia bacterium]